jgi:hypothetical protein
MAVHDFEFDGEAPKEQDPVERKPPDTTAPKHEVVRPDKPTSKPNTKARRVIQKPITDGLHGNLSITEDEL